MWMEGESLSLYLNGRRRVDSVEVGIRDGTSLIFLSNNLGMAVIDEQHRIDLLGMALMEKDSLAIAS